MFRKLYIISRVHIIIVGLKKNKESVVMHSPYMIKRKVRACSPDTLFMRGNQCFYWFCH